MEPSAPRPGPQDILPRGELFVLHMHLLVDSCLANIIRCGVAFIVPLRTRCIQFCSTSRPTSAAHASVAHILLVFSGQASQDEYCRAFITMSILPVKAAERDSAGAYTPAVAEVTRAVQQDRADIRCKNDRKSWKASCELVDVSKEVSPDAPITTKCWSQTRGT